MILYKRHKLFVENKFSNNEDRPAYYWFDHNDQNDEPNYCCSTALDETFFVDLIPIEDMYNSSGFYSVPLDEFVAKLGVGIKVDD